MKHTFDRESAEVLQTMRERAYYRELAAELLERLQDVLATCAPFSPRGAEAVKAAMETVKKATR